MNTTLNLFHEDGAALPWQVRRCDTFRCRLRGLMFRRALRPQEALLFMEKVESRVATTIHMFFVVFPIGVIWLAADGTVVDKQLARPFRPYYAPCVPAQYYLEAAPEILEAVTLGERLSIPAIELNG
ncbi:MAG TPA: hypothetical protein G4N98_01745 [Thermoflexia bacterium]|nr:hypothetical protein [Thermoflexia bacterium]